MTDVGKVNDGTFGTSSRTKASPRRRRNWGWRNAYIETQQPTDYEKNVKQFIDKGYGMIVTVGFMMGRPPRRWPRAYPHVKFAIVDFAYDPAIPNVEGLVFRVRIRPASWPGRWPG